MKRCPKCGGKRFYVTTHIVQGWQVDENGCFIKVADDCIMVTHEPDSYDIWECWECGYDAEGTEFEIEV